MTGTPTALPARCGVCIMWGPLVRDHVGDWQCERPCLHHGPHLVGRYTWDIREHEDTDRASLYVGAASVPEDGTGGAK